jgi:hypothetical protein
MGFNEESGHQAAVSMATQQIEYLRKKYGLATDLIGSKVPESIEEGRATFRAIFAPEVKISASNGGDGPTFDAVGPDAWVDVVVHALQPFAVTQHLIGTQLVTIDSLPNSEGMGGSASMVSYVQAWHADPGGVVDIFIGTYRDKVAFTPQIGWQIIEMRLEKVSGHTLSPHQ